jgi:hypothetical protein
MLQGLREASCVGAKRVEIWAAGAP